MDKQGIIDIFKVMKEEQARSILAKVEEEKASEEPTPEVEDDVIVNTEDVLEESEEVEDDCNEETEILIHKAEVVNGLDLVRMSNRLLEEDVPDYVIGMFNREEYDLVQKYLDMREE